MQVLKSRVNSPAFLSLYKWRASLNYFPDVIEVSSFSTIGSTGVSNHSTFRGASYNRVVLDDFIGTVDTPETRHAINTHVHQQLEELTLVERRLDNRINVHVGGTTQVETFTYANTGVSTISIPFEQPVTLQQGDTLTVTYNITFE